MGTTAGFAVLSSGITIRSREPGSLGACRRIQFGRGSSGTQISPVRMGLNAKNLAKNKRSGKKKGRGSQKNASSTAAPPRAGAKEIDTTRREYIYQMRNVSKTLNNGKQVRILIPQALRIDDFY